MEIFTSDGKLLGWYFGTGSGVQGDEVLVRSPAKLTFEEVRKGRDSWSAPYGYRLKKITVEFARSPFVESPYHQKPRPIRMDKEYYLADSLPEEFWDCLDAVKFTGHIP